MGTLTNLAGAMAAAHAEEPDLETAIERAAEDAFRQFCVNDTRMRQLVRHAIRTGVDIGVKHLAGEINREARAAK